MITPEYLNDIMDAVENKLLDVDNYLLKRIVKRIIDTFTDGTSGKLFIPATINDMRKLMNLGVLYEDLEKAVTNALPSMLNDAPFWVGHSGNSSIHFLSSLLLHSSTMTL